MSSSSNYADEKIMTANPSEMVAPKYEGFTDDGQAFVITSNNAQDLGDGLVLLNSPVANLLESKELSNLVLDSTSGMYDDKNKILTLNENVELGDEEGNKFFTSELKIDLQKNMIFSDNKIDLTSKTGKITADGLQIMKNGNLIIFKGKSKLIINDVKNIGIK
jgi:hypothetical protein